MEDYYSSDEDYYDVDCEEDSELEDLTEEIRLLEFDLVDSFVPSKIIPVEVIPRESLLAAQSEDLRKIMDILSLKEHHARTLLIHYRWDVEKIMLVLVERDKEFLLAEAGVAVSENNNEDVLALPTNTCSVCLEDVSPDRITIMDCGHYFCNTCWTTHFTVRILEGESKRIKCMAEGCDTVCDEAKVRALVGGKRAKLAERFERFLRESYIEDNERVKWCPSVPHCGNAVRVGGGAEGEVLEVECSCGLAFCFGCLSEPHSPCTCQVWKMWGEKCRDASETVNWITANTKPCPKCTKPVEKNGGCNHVTCVCRQSFCWICGKATGFSHTYTAIQGHRCAQLREEATEALAETAKNRLERYTHHHTRYEAHRDSFVLESKLRHNLEEKISKFEHEGSSPELLSWVTKGLERLSQSRKIISFTYPFAFYIFGESREELGVKHVGVKKNLFEDQQQQLETNIERLSLVLEGLSYHQKVDDIMTHRMEIITLTTLVDNQCRQMYECIENEILVSLPLARRIAPYNSNGVQRASKLNADSR